MLTAPMRRFGLALGLGLLLPVALASLVPRQVGSVTLPGGGFQCNWHFISTPVVIDFAKEIRYFVRSGRGMPAKYPIPYTGSTAFEGRGPYTIWPIGKKGTFNLDTDYRIVLNENFVAVGAFYRAGRTLCDRVDQKDVLPTLEAPPFQVGPDEFDAFHYGSSKIKTSKVLQDTREAYLAFDNQKSHWEHGHGHETNNPAVVYPKIYYGDLFPRQYKTSQNGDLQIVDYFLWPVKVNAYKLLFPHEGEPFFAVITKRLQVIGVVYYSRATGEYLKCSRSSLKIESF